MIVEDTYLGDGAYASFDGYSLIIYTHNGVSRTNEIYLEPMCLQKLNEYHNHIKEVINARAR